MAQRAMMFLLPFVLIGLSRLGTETSLRLFSLRGALIAAPAVYYALIAVSVRLVRRLVPGAGSALSLYSGRRPAAWRVALAIALPALPLFIFFIRSLAPIAPAAVAGVIVFALVNGTLEETFWRGVMAHLPARDWVRIVYPAAVFSFMHWFNFLVYVPLAPVRAQVLLVSTFLLGCLWMWFYLRERSLVFPIASHVAIDAFAVLSAAMSFHRR